MSSVAKYRKEIVIDEEWRGKSKVLRNWGKNILCKVKKYILRNEIDSVYPDKMFFFFNIEDYKKMRRMNEIFHKMFMLLFFIYLEYGKVEFIEGMIEEVNKMKKIVKKCDFFNVYYGEGVVFQKKFKHIVNFMEEDGDLEYVCEKILENLVLMLFMIFL